MATFSADVYQNEFLPDGGTDVHAIVTVTCSGAGEAGQSGSGDAAEIVIVDTSGSMSGDNIVAAQRAAEAALDQMLDGVWFAVVAGSHQAQLAYPRDGRSAMVRMDDEHPRPGQGRGGRVPRRRRHGDGHLARPWPPGCSPRCPAPPSGTPSCSPTATTSTRRPSSSVPPSRPRGAASSATAAASGSAWEVAEVRRIATALLGSVDLIADPSEMAADFERVMRQSMGRGVADASLRVWAPQGAQVIFVRQVSPTVDDLTSRRQEVNALTGAYPTGAWGDESRDYHVAVRLPAKAVGQEQLAARVQLAVGDAVVAQGLVKALWSNDDTLTTRIDPAVAHYTGQAELAEAIQDGLAAKAAGDTDTATVKLGRAVQLAVETGNEEATTRLRKIVEIDDAGTGTVRLKRSVDKLDEMALDTASTKTTRVKK